MYRRVEKNCRFECVNCGKRGGADFIACMNHLIDVGAQFEGGSPLAKAQEKARKRVSNDRRKKVRRST